DNYSCDFPLQAICQIAVAYRRKPIPLYLLYGVTKGLFLLFNSKSGDHYLRKSLNIRCQNYIKGALVPDGNSLGRITDKREDQGGSLLNCNGIIAVQISNSSRY